MATLVLTAVGTALGGQIGGAIGGLVGNALDRRLFGPKGREGPRLTELAVQTSSYGTPIPMVFGTMRVAGTVIWSTDLKEARGRTGGGKGQPATTTYSYSASFAVLLSARAIHGIGRIWADGRLVRGAAGDLKVKAALRIHRGTEDQPVDPLIASAESAAPAYRGMAYLVWENLPLADFGNRIPQLTVEVIADAAPVPVTTIARGVSAEVSGAAPAPALAGFAASGSVRGVLEVLGQAAGGWWAPAGTTLALQRDEGPAVSLADAAMTVAGMKGPGRGRQIAAVEAVPAVVALSHYDPARDYQAGVQRAVGIGPGRGTERIEMPAAMSAAAAQALATALLASAGAGRVLRTVTLGFGGMALRPGAVVAITGEAGRWRVMATQVEGMAARITLAPLPPPPLPPGAVDGGRVAGARDERVGATLLCAAELPAGDATIVAAPRLTIWATGAGPGWRQAALMWSVDDGASWFAAEGTAAPAIMGTVEAVSAFATPSLRDLAGGLVVRLARADMMLADADDAALDRGANLALARGELVQFGRAEPLGEGRWRLTRLLRGRLGTEAAAAGAGDAFALLAPDTMRTIELPLAALGREVRVMAAGVADGDGVEARARLDGASVRPPSPVHAAARVDGGLGWIRRSRAGWGWRDGGDAPLVEEAERYRVTLIAPDGGTREVELDAPALPGPIAKGTQVEIRQRGTWAESLPLRHRI